MSEPLISLDQLDFVGSGLTRPECVLAHSSGLLFVPSWEKTGGVSVVDPAGRSHTIAARNPPFPLQPNGIALENGGTFLLAHLGDESGGIYRLHPDGSVEPVVTTVDGKPMPPANFVVMHKGDIWLTVSTRLLPRASDYRRGANSGFIAKLECDAMHSGETDAKLLVDSLGYANEIVIDEDNRRVLVNETFARRLSQIELMPDGSIGGRHVLHEFGPGSYPDGMALDENGNIWVACIISNRLLKLKSPNQPTDLPLVVETVLEDCDQAHLEEVEKAWQADELGRPHLDKVKSRVLNNTSNLAFGGTQRKNIYIGNLLGDNIPWFESDVAGRAPEHWDVELGELERYLN